MRQVFGALAALAIGWGLCAPAHAQELFPLQAISGGGGGGGTGCSDSDSGKGASLGLTCVGSMSDDFTGTSLDTSKWGDSGLGGGFPSPQCSPTESVGSGYLTLYVGGSSACSSQVFATSAFMVPASFNASDYTEVKAKLPASGTGSGSVWEYGQASSGWRSELDLLNEIGSPPLQYNWYIWASDWSSSPAQEVSQSSCCGGSAGIDGDFHTYGMYRNTSTNTVTFYFDGTVAGSYSDFPTGQYGAASGQSISLTNAMQWVFGTCSNSWCGSSNGSVGEYVIDYIHYYH